MSTNAEMPHRLTLSVLVVKEALELVETYNKFIKVIGRLDRYEKIIENFQEVDFSINMVEFQKGIFDSLLFDEVLSTLELKQHIQSCVLTQKLKSGLLESVKRKKEKTLANFEKVVDKLKDYGLWDHNNHSPVDLVELISKQIPSVFVEENLKCESL